MSSLLASNTFSGLELGIGLFGGLGLFLFGMHQMADGLKSAAGAGMKQLLATLTGNRFTAAITGALLTAAIQSSSVTTVLVVGFVSAGLMTLSQSIGVIMGANVGSTITAQIIAFNVTQLPWVLVAIGFAITAIARRTQSQHYGMILLGLGLLFLGMEQMSEATQPLRNFDPFLAAMRRMENPLWGILLGAAFTAIIQSSAATAGIVIVLASQGFLSLEGGIALTIGANVGTCVTAILAAIGKPVEAVRAALIHVLFNLLGAAIWLAFIPQLAEVARAISPSFQQLEGAARLAAETPRQIANAHTIFNVANVLILIWFVTPIAALAMRLVPARPAGRKRQMTPLYLQDVYLGTPSLALERVQLELQHMGRILVRMLEQTPSAVIEGTDQQLREVARLDDDVDQLHAAILKYLRSIAVAEMTRRENERLSELIAVANQLENIGDIAARDLVTQGRHRFESGVRVSFETRQAVRPLSEAVVESLRDALQALESDDAELAHTVLTRKADLRKEIRETMDHLGQRLLADEPHRVELFRLESEIVSQLERLHYHVRQIAKIVVRKG